MPLKNRQRLASAALVILASSIAWIDYFPSKDSSSGIVASPSWHNVRLVLALTLYAAGLITLLSSFEQGRSSAWMRLDWFLPTLRRPKNSNKTAHSLIERLFRHFAPTFIQSNHFTKRRGPIRIGLRRLGISWLASPVRRCVQSVCLFIFLALFFVVCWPYSARPPHAIRKSSGWLFERVDQMDGVFQFRLVPPDDSGLVSGDGWKPMPGERVFLLDAGPGLESDSSLGEYTVASIGNSQAKMLPVGDVTQAMMKALLTSSTHFEFRDTPVVAWPSHYADNLAAKEWIPAETFLVIDPLVSLSTAIASRSWVWSLACAAMILLVCLLIPRGFCGYLCPLGTTIDLFDWAITSRVARFRVPGEGWWVHIKYYLLAGTLVAAVCGVLVSGYFSAIPVITRAMLFLVDPLQNGAMRGWHLLPAFNIGQIVSLLMFFAVLCLGFFRPRFWCKYVCPSGALFSLGNLFRVTERKVESSCINCNKCVEICPFDAIKPDFTTRTSDCTMCQSCGGVCPTHAIKFVERWNVVELKVAGTPANQETSLGRRGFLSLAAGTSAAAVGGIGIAAVTKALGAGLDDDSAVLPVRPPGSVPEQEFLEMCIRCGECFKVCPNNVLQPEGFLQGLEGLWTPYANTDWAGCESSCNACGQVCPTGAIRALPLEEKRVVRMGLAIVNEDTCLPYAGKDACDLCVQECNAAGYRAIEFKQVGTEIDDQGLPVEGSGLLAPVVLSDECVGCGLCQTRCFAINVKNKGLLTESAIVIEAGVGKEDRLMYGSYLELRAQERASKASDATATNSFYVPESSEPTSVSPTSPPTDDSDPF
jgi:ferredoxin